VPRVLPPHTPGSIQALLLQCEVTEESSKFPQTFQVGKSTKYPEPAWAIQCSGEEFAAEAASTLRLPGSGPESFGQWSSTVGENHQKN